jgi:hypothetical protein
MMNAMSITEVKVQYVLNNCTNIVKFTKLIILKK